MDEIDYTQLVRTAAQKRLSLHELHAVLRRHIPGGVVDRNTPPEALRAVLRDLEAGDVLVVPVIPRTLGAAQPRRMPHPRDLPVSLAYTPRADQPGALDPVYAEGFHDQGEKAAFFERNGDRCRYCNLRIGDAYQHVIPACNGQPERVETRYVLYLQRAHLTNDPALCTDEHLAPACPRCHDDAVHRWSAASLTKAAEPARTRLTVICRDQWLSRGREAVREGGLPALGVGGADLLVAHALDLGLPPTPGHMRKLVPELIRVSDADIRAVARAALVRLRMRGLLHAQRDELRRPLCLPAHVTETPPNPAPTPQSRSRNRRINRPVPAQQAQP